MTMATALQHGEKTGNVGAQRALPSDDISSDPVVREILDGLAAMNGEQRELILKTVRTLNLGRH
ncbi:MAG: hypothetical protein E6R08_00710 [Nevskiaceae bacterium]|nr:MAG: hypothetical protein E6R08_00710 [Nevskiaceae bacterium]